MVEENSKFSTVSSTTQPSLRAPPHDECEVLDEFSPGPLLSTTTGHQETPKQNRSSQKNSRLSDYSLKYARNILQTPTEDFLHAKTRSELNRDSSSWHLAPLAFALLPALGGIAFKNGSSIVTDIMLLGLAAIFLNWSVRLPWDWYYAAQARTRTVQEEDENLIVFQERQASNDLSFSSTTSKETPEIQKRDSIKRLRSKELPIQEAAASELYRHESLALLACFALPLLGAYLLHSLRSQLNRPSEGLISNCNLTIFLLASELRPTAHIVKLIRARTLHLQRVVASGPLDEDLAPASLKDISLRLEAIEARCTANEKLCSELKKGDQQSNMIITQARIGLQPDLDTVNRALRRHEKRTTIQAFQIESRFQELEARLNEINALAATPATVTTVGNEDKPSTFLSPVQWVVLSIDRPLRALYILASSSFRLMINSVRLGKSVLSGQHLSTAEESRPSIISRLFSGHSSEWTTERGSRKK